MKHYSKEELDRYRHHGMSVLGRINCAAHLKKSDTCAARLVELEQDDQLVQEIKESLQSYDEAGRTVSESTTNA